MTGSFITTMHLPILQLLCRLFGQSIASPRSVSPLTTQIWLPVTLAFPKAKIAIEREEMCEFDGRTVHKLIQWCLTADLLAQRKSDCSQICSKIYSDWLPNYIKVTRPVLMTFRMAGYFPNRPCILQLYRFVL